MYSNIIALNKSTKSTINPKCPSTHAEVDTLFYSTILEDSAMSTIWISQF